MSKASPSSRNLGGNIKRAREAKNLSQLSLAKLLGYRHASARAIVSRIECGERVPKVSVLLRYAKVLGTSLEALLA